MTDQNWIQDIEISVMIIGASYALSIISLILWVADRAGI